MASPDDSIDDVAASSSIAAELFSTTQTGTTLGTGFCGPHLVMWIDSFDCHRGLNKLAQGGVKPDRNSITRNPFDGNINRSTVIGENQSACVSA